MTTRRWRPSGVRHWMTKLLSVQRSDGRRFVTFKDYRRETMISYRNPVPDYPTPAIFYDPSLQLDCSEAG